MGAKMQKVKVLCHNIFWGGRQYFAGDVFEAPADDIATMNAMTNEIRLEVQRDENSGKPPKRR